jgi:Putative collagen-binding domain of a collagenase
MKPHPELASTGYCLANPAATGGEYLIYLPEGEKVVVDLSDTQEELTAEWLNPSTGKIISDIKTTGGGYRNFPVPFDGDAVLYIKKNTNN